MPQKKNFGFKSVQILFLLIFWKRCDSQVNSEEVNNPPDGPGGDGGGAFFALRSCHQLLHGDSGEFFSPDYLCSNPPLWCNWTITVDPGKRIQLDLEDLTPDDTCNLKQDQIHLDEPAGFFSGHRVLQRCWREAKVTSSSRTLYVVLLIGGRPSSPYRGFHGRFQAFGPPVVFNPLGGLTQRGREPEPEHVDPESQDFTLRADPDQSYDYFHQHAAMRAEPPWVEEDADAEAEFFPQVSENQHQPFVNFSHIHPFTLQPPAPPAPTAPPAPPAPTSTQETRSEPDTEQMSPGQPDPPETPQQIHQDQDQVQEVRPPNRTATATRRNVEEDSDQTPQLSSSEEPEPEEPAHPQPNMMEQLTDNRENRNYVRNHSESHHLPGDHLYEVSVELSFPHYSEEYWKHTSTSLEPAVETLISQKLESLRSHLSLSTKRIKRISVGALYILWLQVKRGAGTPHVDATIRSTMHGLATTPVISMAGKVESAAIMSISLDDVNECGTQMVACDINADCENEFGLYSCHCRPGFTDTSRNGAGGTVCAETRVQAACSSGLSAETKGVYVLFFLLSCLVLALLAAAGTLYHRHHRGAFLVRCHGNASSRLDPNNNNSTAHHHHHHHHHGEGDPDPTPPPPPPPARSFRESWPQVKEPLPPVDLPLLRFSPLLPPSDAFTQPQEGGKK